MPNMVPLFGNTNRNQDSSMYMYKIMTAGQYRDDVARITGCIQNLKRIAYVESTNQKHRRISCFNPFK